MFIEHAVLPHGFAPVGGRAFTFAFSAGPTVDVEHGGVGVDAGDLVGILECPVVDDESTAAHAFERGLGRERVAVGEEVVKVVPPFNGRDVTKESPDFDIRNMESSFEQRDVGLRLVSPESRAPDPGVTNFRFLRTDHFGRMPVEFEVVERVGVKVGSSASEIAFIRESLNPKRRKK